MDWKPNKWIASTLGFFIQPVGMLCDIHVKREHGNIYIPVTSMIIISILIMVILNF